MPLEPSRNLWLAAARKSTPSRTTSSGTAPAAWQASTKNQAPERAATRLSAARSAR